ncbi:hypothetical protein VPH35_011378 [Triticum aestivum]
MDHLLDELLVDILRRLPPRGVAACRTVCKGWRAAVDAGGLLLAVAARAPRPMRGIFVKFSGDGQKRPYLFSRGPTANPSIAVDACALDFMHRLCRGYPWETILDHRNGLLLVNGPQMYVCNPATCRWAELPPRPYRWWSAACLVFDPVVSLHYHVLLLRNTGKGPSALIVQVYSSRTGRWEAQPFIREGNAATIAKWSAQLGDPRRRGAVYWRGALYLNCSSNLIIRLSLDKKTYLVIKTPEIMMAASEYSIANKPIVYLGKSEHGVYYTTIYECQLQVWVLLEPSESSSMHEWVLKHRSNLTSCVRQHYNEQYSEGEKTDKSCTRGHCEWEFIGAGKQREGRGYYYGDGHIELLGYHPYKEIAFLGINKSDGFAYYLGTSELRYLGSISPTGHPGSEVANIQESFIYTPCKDDLLPNHEESVEELFSESFIYTHYLNDALDG